MLLYRPSRIARGCFLLSDGIHMSFLKDRYKNTEALTFAFGCSRDLCTWACRWGFFSRVRFLKTRSRSRLRAPQRKISPAVVICSRYFIPSEKLYLRTSENFDLALSSVRQLMDAKRWKQYRRGQKASDAVGLWCSRQFVFLQNLTFQFGYSILLPLLAIGSFHVCG